MSEVRLWLQAINSTLDRAGTSSSAAQELANLLTLEVQHPQVAGLQNALVSEQYSSDSQISAVVEEARILDGDWPAAKELVKSYLKFCLNVDASDTQGTFWAYANFLNALQAAYSGPRGASLNEVILFGTRAAMRATKNRNHLDWMAGMLLRVFNSIRSDKSSDTEGDAPQRKYIVISVAAGLCRIYFWTKQPWACAFVFGNMHTAGVWLSEFSRFEQVEFRYWLGQFNLLKGNAVAAFQHLYWAYEHCPQTEIGKRIQQSILKRMLLPALLSGRMPRVEVVHAAQLQDAFEPLMACLRSPNVRPLESISYHAFFVSEKVGHLIRDQMPLLVARRAILRLHRLVGGDRMDLATIQIALKVAGVVEEDDDMLVTENVCISLINARLLMANVAPGLLAVRFKSQGAFPRVEDALKVFDPPSGNDSWMVS